MRARALSLSVVRSPASSHATHSSREAFVPRRYTACFRQDTADAPPRGDWLVVATVTATARPRAATTPRPAAAPSEPAADATTERRRAVAVNVAASFDAEVGWGRI